jgi:RimJ/RimL family protein N-acetyltransferase
MVFGIALTEISQDLTKNQNFDYQKINMLANQFNLQPVLENELLQLRPLKEEDFESLYKVASDPLIWEQHPAKERSEREGFKTFFSDAMKSGSAFVVIDKDTGEVMGSTRFYPVDGFKNAISIGWTFIARKYWGGAYNGTMKHLMIEYAFNYVDNVLFHIHENNTRSQKAVEKIGGKRITSLEGTILNERPNASVIYCIRKGDWKGK